MKMENNSIQINCALLLMLLMIAVPLRATKIQNCPKSEGTPLTENDVTISSCTQNVCDLKRNTDVSVEMKLKPQRDFEELNTNVEGIILDVPLPFPGYYGTSACPHIYDADGAKQVGCPLKAGETYTYKNSFKVLPVYPTVSLTVNWALSDKNGDVACFRVPAKIKA